MKYRPLSRASRRGYTLAEVALAGSMLVVVATGAIGVLSTAGRMQVTTQLRTEAGQSATMALANIVQDLREAESVTIPATYRMRIYYPEVDAAGFYDRFSPDTTNYIEYSRCNAQGTVSASGTYLRRTFSSGSSSVVAENVTGFTATLITSNSVRLTLKVRRTSGSRYSEAILNQKVVFLRNH